MEKETITEGPSLAEALDAALEELGVQQDAVEYEVLDEGGRGVLGLGAARSARVRVWLKDSFVREMEEAERGEHEAVDEPHIDEPDSGRAAAAVEEPPIELSDEELDRVADEASSTIRTILEGFGIEASIEEYEGDEAEIILDVVGSDLAVLIGRHGRTLDSLQVLVSAITNRRLGFRFPVLVDVEGYRNRRRSKLEEISRRAAERAARQHAPVRLRPMSSYERRIVHLLLRDDGRVTTASEGDEPNRQVVVFPKQ